MSRSSCGIVACLSYFHPMRILIHLEKLRLIKIRFLRILHVNLGYCISSPDKSHPSLVLYDPRTSWDWISILNLNCSNLDMYRQMSKSYSTRSYLGLISKDLGGPNRFLEA